MNAKEIVERLEQIPLELDRIRTELSVGLQSFHNARPLEGARYVGAGRPLVWGGSGRLVGWSLRAAGGAVSVTLRDGRDESGEPIAVLELVDGDTDTRWFGPGGVSFPEGLYLERAGAGQLEGAVWLGAVD